MDYIQQRDAALAEINTLIGPNGTGAITGQVHRDNERNQTNDAYANLMAYDGFSFAVVRQGATASANGTNLLAAYTAAVATNPNGAAKSATNRFGILLLPGVYDLGQAPLTLNNQFIDIIGLGAATDIIVTSAITAINSGTVVKSVNDVVLQNFTIQNTADNYASGAATEASGYAPQGSYPAELFRNMVFRNLSGASGSSFIRRGQTFSGTYDSCIGVDASNLSVMFDGAASTATFNNCRYTGPAFGHGLAFQGSCTNCVAGNNSFGYFQSYDSGNLFAGTQRNCTGGNNSFGYQANATISSVVRCSAGSSSFYFGGRLQGVEALNCNADVDSFGTQSDIVSATFNGCYGYARSFAHTSTIASLFVTSCTGQAFCFGYNSEFNNASVQSVRFVSCTGGSYCFGTGGATNYLTELACYIDCVGESFCFGSNRVEVNGQYSGCTANSMSFAAIYDATPPSLWTDTTGARFTDCTVLNVSGAFMGNFFCARSLVGGSAVVNATLTRCIVNSTAGGNFCGVFAAGASIEFSGVMDSCISFGKSFCHSELGTSLFSGVARKCVARSQYAFGSTNTGIGGEFSGTAEDCTVDGGLCFGSETRSGRLLSCKKTGSGSALATTNTASMYYCYWNGGLIVSDDAVVVGGVYLGSIVPNGSETPTATIDMIGLTGTISGSITNTVASPHITVIP